MKDTGPEQKAARRYAELKERGLEATRAGDFVTALDTYRRARKLAREKLESRVDEAELNVAMVWLQIGEAKKGEDGLREILLRARDDSIALAAAYNLASSLRRQGRHERALVYAQRALERARKLGATDKLAMVHNLIGNILLSQTYLEEALGEYETALTLRESQGDGEDTRYSRAILLENLGYCLLLRGEHDEGMARIRDALDLAESVGDLRCRVECMQDLCYGLLLTGEFDDAVSEGELALAMAEEAGYRDIAENCHYLLGELGTRTGDQDLRDYHFQRLQNLHPELPFLKDFLCAVDVTQIITLKR